MPNYKVLNGNEMPLFTEVTDGTQTLNITNGAAVTLDTNLYEIYIGNGYILSDLFSGVSNNAYANIRFVTGGKETHIQGFVAADGQAIISLYRNPTYSASGTALTIYNLNGNSTNTTVNKARQVATANISSPGTLLYQTLLPAGKGSKAIGGESSSTSETILRNSGDYLYRVQNTAALQGSISIEFTWYEI